MQLYQTAINITLDAMVVLGTADFGRGLTFIAISGARAITDIKYFIFSIGENFLMFISLLFNV
jgi:hypothetical protein